MHSWSPEWSDCFCDRPQTPDTMQSILCCLQITKLNYLQVSLVYNNIFEGDFWIYGQSVEFLTFCVLWVALLLSWAMRFNSAWAWLPLSHFSGRVGTRGKAAWPWRGNTCFSTSLDFDAHLQGLKACVEPLHQLCTCTLCQSCCEFLDLLHVCETLGTWSQLEIFFIVFSMMTKFS